MNDSPAVSILVPIYKVEKYLSRCIESVLAQDFTDWELILVDDGSPDRCPEICDEYAQKYERIRVVHKENGGLVSARQSGFSISTGRYILHVDSDDWLMPNALSSLFHYAEQGQYDIVRGCNRRVGDDGGFTIERGRFFKGEVLGSEEYLEKVIIADFEPYLWGALYRRDLFRKETFEPILHVSTGEDWLTNIAIGNRVKKVLCVEDVVYNYFINSNSMMQQQVCSFEYADRVKGILEEITAQASAHIKHLVACNRIAAYINCLFIPELPFSRTHFHKVKSFISENGNEEDVRKLLDVKFMKFIHIPVLFFLYSRLYCFLFKYIKLKGNKRKVLI
ncbi:MAG: glycosyltransferase [Prevotella sp.]|nr:glycosyltransferase [Prevotella sp.]